MASREWVDVQEGEGFVGLEELVTRDLAFDNSAEEAGCGGGHL